MRFRFEILPILLFTAAAAYPGVSIVLYNNRDPGGTPLLGLSSGPTADNGTAAPAGTEWSECQHPTGDLTQANNSNGSSVHQGSFRLADDFVVPNGALWEVSSIHTFAYRTNAPAAPSPIVASTLQIWGPCTPGTVPGDAGCTAIAFGDTTTNRLASSTDASLFRIFSSVVGSGPNPPSTPGTARKIWRNQLEAIVTLAPGYYWVDWSSTADIGGSHFAPTLTVPGTRGLAGWNARQFNVMAGLWVAVADTGQAPEPSPNPPDVPQDFPFLIFGLSDGIFADGFESGDRSGWSQTTPP